MDRLKMMPTAEPTPYKSRPITQPPRTAEQVDAELANAQEDLAAARRQADADRAVLRETLKRLNEDESRLIRLEHTVIGIRDTVESIDTKITSFVEGAGGGSQEMTRIVRRPVRPWWRRIFGR